MIAQKELLCINRMNLYLHDQDDWSVNQKIQASKLIQSELHNKGNYVAKIPIFYVQSGDPKSRAQTGKQGQEDKERQQ